jgi:para-nitrobenzyl esterase
MKTGFIALAAALALLPLPASAAIEQAKTTAGTVQGEVVDGISEFKGIPFAAPPVGDLRWKAPQPPKPWSGVKQTIAFGPACMQGAIAQMGSKSPASEDCLYIDVWSPANAPADKLPVIAWIYGGGFNSGATSVPLYDGANFAKSGVVFVSLSYRVGVFGFLASPQLSGESGHGSGNYGLLDMIAGLKWVRDNIAQFGGDPGKVTIMGHSAGGFAVSMLNASPLAKGLFRGLISESGGNFTPPQAAESWGGTRGLPLARSETIGQAWLESLGAHTLAEARALPAATLEQAQHKPGAPPAQPPVDDYVIPGDQYLLWQQGKFNDVPILIGTTSDETAVFGSRKTTAADFVSQIRAGYGAKADEILAAFPHATDAEATDSARRLANETVFHWNTFAWARLQAEHGKHPAFAYYFDRPTAQNPNGSGHGSEVGLVFANEDNRPGRAPWTDEDRALSNELHSYWANFAKTGDPNGPDLPQWPRFTASKPSVLKLGAETKVIAVPNATQLKAVDDYFAWRRGSAE